MFSILNLFSFILFRRHRCIHGPTPDESTGIFKEDTEVRTTTAYQKEFIGKNVTNVEQIRTPAKKPEDNLKPEGTIEFTEKTPFKPADRVTATKPKDNLVITGDFEGNDSHLKFNRKA